MPFTQEDRGLLNNFAPETKTYHAQPPTKAQQRNYVLIGMGAIALVSSLLFVAYTASNVS